MRSFCWLVLGFFFAASPIPGADLRLTDDQPLRLPPVGSYQLRILTPSLLELTLVTAKAPDPAPASEWNFADDHGQLHLPAPDKFAVSAGSKSIPVSRVGFRRRVIYAPFKNRDLRVGNYLYLELASDIGTNQTVEVKNPDRSLWAPTVSFRASLDPFRLSPALHVNQTGYLPACSKLAMVGCFVGNLGELDVTNTIARSAGTNSAEFQVVDSESRQPVFRGTLRRRADVGFEFPCYDRVFEADFTALKKEGAYRLVVPGLGASFPFRIGNDVAAALARDCALGIYHQRCGFANALPFTRFTHAACHLEPAVVPESGSGFVNECLERMTEDFRDNPRHTAPRLKSVSADLYPFVNRKPVDVHGGHHDAGDYSKYTINSAAFIHYLVFAADVFPGVSALDNLGLPESSDYRSDVLQEAKWEADFLARMQDADGGFYFLVYPREREYEFDALPDAGDPQVVFPKTTAVTAAAVAALAQCASSPTFKKQFPDAAALYLDTARKGWAFLERAIARYGKDGAYQKITHYGNDFMHDDELAWAACEMFLATGDPRFQSRLLEWLHPDDPATRLWGWWRLYGSYGCAIRSYAFAAQTGRMPREKLDAGLLEKCRAEIAIAGEDQLKRAGDCAYGTSFPIESKRVGNAGWYFSSDAAFDLAVACQLDYPERNDPRMRLFNALLGNLNYEQGCNPVNVTYLTGLGWKRQREIVDQYAQNDRRALPPSGIPLGNVQAGISWLELYGKEPAELSFPPDGASDRPYPFYDRWSDAFNLSQEFVIVNQARELGYLAWLMAQTSFKDQPWKSARGNITGVSNGAHVGTALRLELSSPDLDLTGARTVWEAKGQEPFIGPVFSFIPDAGVSWVEAEAQLPDGRRVFGVTEFSAK